MILSRKQVVGMVKDIMVQMKHTLDDVIRDANVHFWYRSDSFSNRCTEAIKAMGYNGWCQIYYPTKDGLKHQPDYSIIIPNYLKIHFNVIKLEKAGKRPIYCEKGKEKEVKKFMKEFLKELSKIEEPPLPTAH